MEIKMMPVIAYNQYQAYAFWLNATQAIIMNYLTYAPQWAEQYTIEGEKFYLVFLSKGLKDMPTLKIKKDALRRNINVLIEKWVLKRKIIETNKPLYKVCDEWLTTTASSSSPQAIKVGDVSKALKEWKINVDELKTLLSSYSEKKKEMKYQFSDNIKGGLSLLLKERLPSLKIDLNRHTMTDKDIEDIKEFIITLSVDVGLIKKEVNGEFSGDSIAIVLTTIKERFNFHWAKRTLIKNIKSSLNTWINNSVKFKKQ